MNKTNWLVEIEHQKTIFVNCDEADSESEAIEFCKKKHGILPETQVKAKVTPYPPGGLTDGP